MKRALLILSLAATLTAQSRQIMVISHRDVDRLGEADHVDKWQDVVDRGVVGIQTDRPAELVRYLRSKKLHK